jgi:hypothetical protein
VEDDESAAKDVIIYLDEWITGCPERTEEENPGTTTTWEDYGPLEVEDGAHVYGVFTATPGSEKGAHLYSIGRDGDTVTVLVWTQTGEPEDAPVADFQEMTRTAVEKLH